MSDIERIAASKETPVTFENPIPPSDDHDGLVSGLLLDGKGGEREVEWPEIKHWSGEMGPLWVHLNRTVEEADHYVRHDAQLDPIVVDALLASDTRPRMVTHGQGMIVVMRGVNLNPRADPEDINPIRIHLVLATHCVKERDKLDRLPPEILGTLR